jgi:hypothetical protein
MVVNLRNVALMLGGNEPISTIITIHYYSTPVCDFPYYVWFLLARFLLLIWLL